MVDVVTAPPFVYEIAVLATLTRLQCATLPQLHTLCFPDMSLASARVKLHTLHAAELITRSAWQIRLPHGERGAVWTVTPKGVQALAQHHILTQPAQIIDLGRPSTMLEHVAWLAALATRTLITRLILEARRSAHLASLLVEAPICWPTTFDSIIPCTPDARLHVAWTPPTAKPPAWLPWLDAATCMQDTIAYSVIVDRHTDVAALLNRTAHFSDPADVLVLILADDERCVAARHWLHTTSHRSRIRITTWHALQDRILDKVWLDGLGHSCTLHLQPHEYAATWQQPTTA